MFRILVRIVSWNVNGVRAIVKKGFVDAIESLSADIICLQEVKASAEQIPPELTNLAGYSIFSCHAERKGYSGVTVLTRIEPKFIGRGLGIEAFDVEGRVLQIDFEGFTLLNVYFPNGSASPDRLAFKLAFYDEFLSLIQKLHCEGKKVVVCGDLNTAHKEIDLARPKENSKVSGFLPEERAWIDTFLAGGMVDSFRHLRPDEQRYTWWDMKTRARDRNVGWRLDYFFISDSLKPNLLAADIHGGIMGSDHCPVSVDLDL